MPFAPLPEIDAWQAAHPLHYNSGEEIKVGDTVDFGFPQSFYEEPWYGTVTGFVGSFVVVDTFWNKHERYVAGDLRIINRLQEQSA